MPTGRVRLGLVALLAAVIFAVVALFFWDFVRDTVVVPFYFLLWFMDLLLKSLPQEVYLLVLVVVCIMIGLNAVRGAQTPPRPRSRQVPPSDGDSRYVFWTRHHNNLYSSPFFRHKFATETRKFILNVLAYQEGEEVAVVEQMIISGALPVPAAVKDLVQSKEIRSSRPVSVPRSFVAQRFSRLLARSAPHHDPLTDQQVREIIGFIEHRLEITHAGNVLTG